MNSLAKPRSWERFFWPILAAAALLALWHFSVLWTGTKVFPSPLSVEKGIVQLFHKHLLWADIGDSLRRVALGFGAAVLAAIFLVFLASFFPIVVACISGVSSVSPNLRSAGRNFGLSAPHLLMRVIFPAALPQILVGLRIALGIAWLVVVAAEMIAVDSGLGYLVIDSRNSGKRYDLVVAAMLMIGIIGLTLDILMRSVERLKSVRWGFRNAS